MKEKITGKVFVLGDNIDTDQIIPAHHLVYSLDDPEESKLYGKYALSGVPDGQSGLPFGNIPFINAEQFQSSHQIIIAGKNFGCGSSREHAPFALQKAGVTVVIAQSYARIFYRNAVDGGFLLPYESEIDLLKEIETNHSIEIDIIKNQLISFSTNKTYFLKSLGEVAGIIEVGGIFEYRRKYGMVS